MATINYDYYSGNDRYSDEKVEDELLTLFSGSELRESESMIKKNDSILKFYHLSPVRKGLLHWYQFKPHSAVLEIGGGCGALTGELCEKCERVITIEMSKRRAQIIYERYKDFDNLEIIVCDLHSLPSTLVVDYVVAIGVMEYQGIYGSGDNPYKSFLEVICSHLIDDGRLLLAIENKLGIKYFAGAPEDHIQVPYVGIQNYREKGKARTFSKFELNKLLKGAGLNDVFYYYPMPDYRISLEVFSDSYLPHDELGLGTIPYYGEFLRSLVFDERIVYRDLFENDVFGVFANSFFIDAGRTCDRHCDVIYAKCSYDRTISNRMCTMIHTNQHVTKEAITDEAKQNIVNCKKNSDLINYRNCAHISAVHVEVNDNAIEMPFISEMTLLRKILNAISERNINAVEELFNIYYLAILESSEIIMDSNLYGPIMSEVYVEMTLSNCFIDSSNRIITFDLEKVKKNGPANYLIYRAVEHLEGLTALYGYEYDFQSIKEKYNLTPDIWDEYSSELENYYKDIFVEEAIDPLRATQNTNEDIIKYNNIILSGNGLVQIEDTVFGRKIYEDIFKDRKEENYRCKYNAFLSTLFDNKTDISRVITVGWGAGNCFLRNSYVFSKIADMRYVCDIDNTKWNKKLDDGIIVISPDRLNEYESLFVIIMIIDAKKSSEVKNRLNGMGIKCENIVNVLRAIY